MDLVLQMEVKKVLKQIANVSFTYTDFGMFCVGDYRNT